MHQHPAVSAAPPPARRPDDRGAGSSHRVLVVADDCATSEAFVSTIVEHADGRPVEAFVVAPALGSRFARLTSDDGAYAEAQRHLDATLDALGRAGIAARGHIGSHDPIQAADDGLREFPADEVVFATHPPEEADRLEADAVDVARARYEVPVTHLVVDRT
jgi:GABA permease